MSLAFDCTSCVHNAMTRLQSFMDTNNIKDGDLAPKARISRVQMSRIRRGISHPSRKTAKLLEAATAIPASELIFGATA